MFQQIEAATFMHFLSTHYTLMTLEQVQEGVPLPVTTEDFLLGVADLTGEVMRYSSSCILVTVFAFCLTPCAQIRHQ